MNGTTNKTAAKAREELAALDRALAECANPVYLRWETLARALEAQSFPYILRQTCRNELGEVTRSNRYYWQNRKWTEGALYINETAAGISCAGVKNAVNALRRILEAYAA